MGQPGRVVITSGGQRGVLSNGKAAVFNANSECLECCEGGGGGGQLYYISYRHFTDDGFINGGQNGAFRDYEHPSLVPASPWWVSDDWLNLILYWEYDYNCQNHNPYTQKATVRYDITVLDSVRLTIDWSGVAEAHRQDHERLTILVDDNPIGSAESPGGNKGCAHMEPVICTPTPPQSVILNVGDHTFFVDATTVDELYHYDAWYSINLTFERL